MYRISKTYERLQLYNSYIDHIKEYCLYTNSRKKLILSFYEVVKYTFMNYQSKYCLKFILEDLSFIFNIHNEYVIEKMFRNYTFKANEKEEH
jgi:hypothetical protein